MSLTRKEVFNLITEERSRAQAIVRDLGYSEHHTIGEHLVLIETYLRQTFDSYTHHTGNDEALRELVKTVALGVRCLEQHGDVLKGGTA